MIIKKVFTKIDSLGLKIYLAEITQFPILSIEDELELFNELANGNEKARQKIIESNLRYVVAFAKQFVNKRAKLADLINEGNIGLMSAIDKFDVTRGFKFITFANWDILQKINIFLEENNEFFRLPSGKVKLMSKIKLVINKLTMEYNRTPTKNELLDELDELGNSITPTMIDAILDIQNTSVVSFDKPFIDGEGGEGNLYDITASDALETDHLVDSNPASNQLKSIMGILSDVERDVVIEINGLYGHEVRTMTQIGDELGMTSSRVQQINAKALKKLRGQVKTDSFQNMLN